MLLGVRAAICESFERIHRANLVGMGVLPCTYEPGQSAKSLGLTGQETFEIEVPENVQPLQKLKVKAGDKQFNVICRLNTPVEVDYYRNGGILHTVLRKMAR
jgi:aconitate hydratase